MTRPDGPAIARGDSVSSLADLHAYWRAANYLGAAQIYLQANFLLETPLRPEHIKPRLLGHWGTAPHACGGNLRRELKRPDFRRFAVDVRRPGSESRSDMTELGKYLAEVIRLNADAANFRIVCPDEMTSNRDRFIVNGYREEGTTTTPFDLLVMNGVDRYHVLIQAVQAAAPTNPAVAAQREHVIERYERKLAEHRQYVKEHGEDPPEIAAWVWDA